MPDSSILILPGLDGTDLMLGRFRELCATKHRATVGTLPDDTMSDYSALADHFASMVAEMHACHIIAESFSGPIGILLAKRHPEIVTRLTLIASFATSPMPKLGALLPWTLVFRYPMPNWVARHFFVGEHRSVTPVLKNAVRQNTPAILRHRLNLVQKVNLLEEYSELKCRLSYLRPSNDRLVPQRCLDELLNSNPATIVHEIEGTHLILETQPENAWRQIAT